MSILPSQVIEAAHSQDFVPECPQPPVKPPREAQYLIAQVGPPLKSGLAEVVSKMPRDPIEYLAHYLYKHAESVAHLEEVTRQAEEMKEALIAQEEERQKAIERDIERKRLEEEEREKERLRLEEEAAEEARRLAAEEEAKLTVTLAPVREETEATAEKVEGDADPLSQETQPPPADGTGPTDEEATAAHEEKLETVAEQEEPAETPAPTADETEEKPAENATPQAAAADDDAVAPDNEE